MSSMSVPVGQICQTSLLSCAPNMIVTDVAALLHAARCSSIIVMEDGKALGIWTERDALMALRSPERLDDPISRWMSTPVKTINASVSLADAGVRMKADHVRHLLVIADSSGDVCGIISQSDVVLNHGIESFMQLREIRSVLKRKHEWIDAEVSLAHLAKVMSERGTDAIAISYADGVHGIITERDVVRLLSQGQTEGPVGQYASRPLVTVLVSDTLYIARRMLATNNLRHLGVVDKDGTLVSLLSFSDILGGIETEYIADLHNTLQEREEALALSRGKLRLAGKLFETTLEGIIITDNAGVINAVNPAFCKLIGLSEDGMIGKPFSIIGSGRHDPEFFNSLWKCLRKDGVWQGEIWGRKKDGELFLKMVTITGIEEDGHGWSNFAAMFADIVSNEQNAARLHYLANYDPLTALPNRSHFIEQLAQTSERARTQNFIFGLLFLDIDRFRLINETLGYDVGDDLLLAMSRRIVEVVGGKGRVARLGGDQFGIILNRLATAHHIDQITEAILKRIAEIFDIQGHELFVTASVGIAVFPSCNEDYRSLLTSAETALGTAQQQGRNCYRYAASSSDFQCRNRLGMESRLRRAVDRNEFEVYYQPKISLSTLRVIGMEALVRWVHPEIGVVQPIDFISIAEENGLISVIGELVLDAACAQTQIWRSEIGPLRVAVNLSGRQLNPSLLKIVDGILERTGFPAENLELEITETVAMENVELTMEVLSGIAERGISLSIDDFGTGYSSFAYLRKFPIHVLKIDRSFVKDIDHSERDGVIPKAIISMAHSLGLEVVAEGIETTNQLALLRSFGCDEGQGYYFSQPIPAAAFATYCFETMPHNAARPTNKPERL